jgi:Domain of unknown function (DUF222)
MVHTTGSSLAATSPAGADLACASSAGAAASAATTPVDSPLASASAAGTSHGAATSARTSGAAMTLPQVATIVATMEMLAAQVSGAGGWSGEERHRVLAGLDRAVDGLAAVRAAVLVAERDAGTWQGDGDRSIQAWRARVGRVGPRIAAAQVRQADHLAAAPDAVDAVIQGRIGVEHAAVIGAVTGGTPAQQQAAADPAVRRELLTKAEEQDAATFSTTAATWAATIDPAALEADHQTQRANRFLHLATTAHGTVLKGRLDTMAGHRLTLALEALSPRPGVDDDRDLGQRRADAMDTMAQRILSSSDTKPGAHVPTQVTMILTEHTWIAARAERDRRRSRTRSRAGATSSGGADALRSAEAMLSGDTMRNADDVVKDGGDAEVVRGADATVADGGSGEPAGAATQDTEPALRYPPATLEDGTPVPVSELAAAMCDCEITRIVIDAAGVPLDLSRAERVFTGPQRRAVIARDRHCAWPDCQAPARWCHVHHIAWWQRDDGPTSVDNGVALCSYHHHEVHRHDLTITRTAVPPDHAPGSPPGSLARVAYELRDRAGRTIGHAGAMTAPAVTGTDSGPPTLQGSPGPAEAAVEDTLPLAWTTDPMTGAMEPMPWLGT